MIGVGVAMDERASPFLKLHIEPNEPIELVELTGSLSALSHQYQLFAIKEGLAGRAAEARLLVPSVSHGSIDINLVPDFNAIVGTVGPLLPVMIGHWELIEKFADRIKWILDLFTKDGEKEEVNIRDCDDAINLVKPIAQHGGHQTFNIHNGPKIVIVAKIDAKVAREITQNASKKRDALTEATSDKKQRVSMVWAQLARDAAKTDGAQSPDKGIIAEIDATARPVFFTDEMSYLKKEMIDDEENPLQKVFFVDVDISRKPNGKVGNYRITGYHGKDDI